MHIPLRFHRHAFVAGALVLFIATHWPKLEIPGEGRPDLLVHIVAFALWEALLIGAAFFGPALSLRNIAWCAAIGPVYAAIDEALQGIPFVNRHPGFDDWLANCTGILLAVMGALALRAAGQARSRS